jgi:hypothetical protein
MRVRLRRQRKEAQAMMFRTKNRTGGQRRATRLFARAAVLALIASLGSAVFAQQLNGAKVGEREPRKDTPASKDDPVELAKTITALEERIKQLETKLARLGDTSVKSEPSAAPNAAEVAEVKKEVAAIQEEAKKNSSFLNFFRDVEVSGLVDGYYGYNFNHPDHGFNTGRNFDFRHNSFNLNYAEVVFEKKNDLKDRLGFRLDLGFGPTADWVHSADPTGGEVVKQIQQAYLSYVAPVGSGLTIDFGKFVTVHGAEVIETKDNFNYSRSYLFSYAIPYYHTGLRAKYSFNDQIAVTGLLVNGWDNFTDNNGGKTLGVTLSLTPTKKLSLVQNYMAGPEQPGDNTRWRHLSDTTLTYVASDKLTLMGNFDYGRDALTNGTGGHWKGFAGYLRYAFTNKLAFAPRFEVFDDHDGFRTGLRQTLKEFTLTQEFKLASNLLARLEFRRDSSDQDFFSKSFGRAVRHQNTLLVGFSYFFSSRGQ